MENKYPEYTNMRILWKEKNKLTADNTECGIFISQNNKILLFAAIKKKNFGK